MVDEDEQAWLKYPQHRKWFNKLYVADAFGYKCGPAGIAVPEPNQYVVRPIYNLAGMGVGAKVMFLKPEDIDKIPPGYFWVEYFQGTHYSVDYVKENGKFKQLNCYIGKNSSDNLSVFKYWSQVNHEFQLPKVLQNLDVPKLNIEAIGDKIFEVHLRNGFDHMMEYKEIYPVFTNKKGKRIHFCPNVFQFEYIDGEADGYGYLEEKRIGYYVRKEHYLD